MITAPRVLEQGPSHFNDVVKALQGQTSLTEEQVNSFIKTFPFVLTFSPTRVEEMIEQLMGLRLTDDELVRVLTYGGAILGEPVQRFKGIKEFFTEIIKLKKNDFRRLIVACPQFLMANKEGRLGKKLSMIYKNGARSFIYMRHLIRRHPDILLVSLDKFEQKYKLKY